MLEHPTVAMVMFHSFIYKRKCLARKYIDVIYYEFLKKSRGNGTVPANNGHVGYASPTRGDFWID